MSELAYWNAVSPRAPFIVAIPGAGLRARRLDPGDLHHARGRRGRGNPEERRRVCGSASRAAARPTAGTSSYNNSVMIDARTACSTGSSSGARTASLIRNSPRASSPRTAPRTGSSTCAKASSSRTARSSPPTTRSTPSTFIAATPSRARPAVAAIADVQKLDKNQIKITLNSGRRRLPLQPDRLPSSDGPNGFKDWAQPVTRRVRA